MPQAFFESTAMQEAAPLEILCNVFVPRSQKRRSVLNLIHFCKREDRENTFQQFLVSEDEAGAVVMCAPVHDYLPLANGPPAGVVKSNLQRTLHMHGPERCTLKTFCRAQYR